MLFLFQMLMNVTVMSVHIPVMIIIMLNVCFKLLCKIIMLNVWFKLLYKIIMLNVCFKLLYKIIMLNVCSKLLYKIIMLNVCFKLLCKIIMLNVWFKLLFKLNADKKTCKSMLTWGLGSGTQSCLLFLRIFYHFLPWNTDYKGDNYTPNT
jgi:hypothetical protein